MKKYTLLFLTTFLLLTGCRHENYNSDDGVDEKIDKSRTQLYVSNFNGGYGDSWLRQLKKKFEEKYKDESFENDKLGVQVVIDNSKTQGNHLLATIPTSNNNVFFCESVFYYDYLNAGVMADISDVVNTDLAAYGDSGTILDKFSDAQKSFYQTAEGKVFGIPHYEGFYGLTYDLKLWEDKKLYIAADPDKAGKVNALYDGDEIALCRNASQVKSNGPDGKAGTSDDGFPATYKEFADVMAIMVKKGITPITWSGKYQLEYNAKFLAALAADYEGAEQLPLQFNYNGTATNLVEKIPNSGVITKKEATTINNATGYKTFESAGRYYALKFMEQIVSNPKYFGERSFVATEDHLGAQQTYLLSYPEEAIRGNAIAMLPEGNYWENEAANSGTFDYAETNYGSEYSRANRRIAMMPLPKATEEQVGEKTTLLGFLNSLCFLNKNCDELHLRLGKEFLIMANTNESLAEFNVITNAPKAIKYTLSEEQYNSLNCFGKSVYDLAKNGNLVQAVTNNQIYANDVLNLDFSSTFQSKVGSTVYNNPVKEMCTKTTASTKTAEVLFNGIRDNYNEAYWSKYSKYF